MVSIATPRPVKQAPAAPILIITRHQTIEMETINNSYAMTRTSRDIDTIHLPCRYHGSDIARPLAGSC